MVNKTPVSDKSNIGYLPKVFNAGINIVGNESVEFQEIKLDYFKNSYRERTPIYAVAENTSAAYFQEDNSIRTDNIPRYYQLRLKTKDGLSKYVEFAKLIEDPVGNLTHIYREMKADYEKCEQEFRTTRFASANAKERFKAALEEYEHEVNRFKKGIEQIEYKDYVKKAFVYMNQAFMTQLSPSNRVYSGWRLFQIVFIVSLICEMIRSEYKNDRAIAEADIETANLLYFPTGGGKTEAFLGACVFNMFFDRLRGKNDGYDEGWDAAAKTMTEHMVELPKDADGEPVHVGDVMEWVRYEDDDPTIVRKVSAVGADVFFAWSDEQGRYAQYEAHAYRHHHKPTVEDVLTELTDEVWNRCCIGMTASDSGIRELVAEYAAKLRLAEEDA